MSVARDDVLAAADRIRGRVHRTPTFTSRTLGPTVRLKAELFQKTGSFKARGVLNKLGSLARDERARGVIGISAGNHAQALAWGAASEGLDCLVVMWRGASEAKLAATRGYGAAVDLEASDPAAAFERLEALNSQLDGSTLEAALALMVVEYRAEAQARRQAIAFASGAQADRVDVGQLSDLDELAARIDLVATVRERIGARDER